MAGCVGREIVPRDAAELVKLEGSTKGYDLISTRMGLDKGMC